MDRQEEIFEAIQSLTTLIEENINDNTEIKSEIKELKKVTEYHNEMILKLLDKIQMVDDIEYITNKMNEIEKEIKKTKIQNALFLVATSIGFIVGLEVYK